MAGQASRPLSRRFLGAGLPLFLTLLSAAGAGAQESRPSALLAVPFQGVTITDETFWLPRLRTTRKVTLEANLRQCEETNRIRNFAVCAGLVQAKHEGALYNDSDIYKVLEGAAYVLALERDPVLEKRIDAIIDLIAGAQQKDGYLNTYWTLVKPGQRWTNIHHGHEMYCAGHLIEAAVAYAQATGKTKFLDVARRLADHIDSVFGPTKRHDCPGHEELELALVKLWRQTGEKRYFELARYFIDQRGRADGREPHGEYAQDHRPVREQFDVVGHAVRAMYLYCGMADVAAVTGDAGLLNALQRVWHDVVDTKMYVTGGIGNSASNEGFTKAYDLPNESAYCETCAAIGMALWNHRMYLLTGEGRFADIMEREIYNGLLSGVSTSGDRFFYDNPLASLGQHQRVPWFGCSCCPTNIVRYLPALGERIFAHRGNQLDVVLYVASRATVPLDVGPVTIEQRTDYPWSGQVAITVRAEKPATFDLRLRVPGWCASAPEIAIDGVPLTGLTPVDGFVTIHRAWKGDTLVSLGLPMDIRRVYAHPEVAADQGRVALMRGPLVYCVEGIDHGGVVRNLVLAKDARLSAVRDLETGLDQVSVLANDNGIFLQGDAVALDGTRAALERKPRKITAIPYFSWANRGANQMQVWFAETDAVAELPSETGLVNSNGVGIRASHCFASDHLSALNDGLLPKSSSDASIPRMTFWDHRGTSEWITYSFEKPRRLSRASAWWFDDGPRGGCRLPAGWKMQWRDGGDWRDVKLNPGSSFTVTKDAADAVTFEPFSAFEIRLEVTLKPGFSGGLLEWSVE